MSIAAKLVLLIACLVVGFAAGVKYHAGRDAIAEQARQVNQRATERLQRQNSNTAAVAHESDKVRIETEYRDVIKEVDRVVTQVVYRDTVCLPPDGLRVIGDAIARAYGDPGEPGNAVPKVAAPK